MVDGLVHVRAIVDGKQLQLIERGFGRRTPDVGCPFVFQFPIAEGEEYGVEFQSLGLMDGQDTDTLDVARRDGLEA